MQAGSPRSPRAPSCGPAALRQAKELEIKVILLLNHSKMQFLLLASHAEARQRRKTANKLFFALFFCAMSSPFCLRKNSLLFPNPQPIARPLPTAGPKLNKSVVCMRKLLGWAGHVTEWGAQKHAWKPLWGCSPQLLRFAQALSLILKAKGYLGHSWVLQSSSASVIYYFTAFTARHGAFLYASHGDSLPCLIPLSHPQHSWPCPAAMGSSKWMWRCWGEKRGVTKEK